jgi:hypothetical protein
MGSERNEPSMNILYSSTETQVDLVPILARWILLHNSKYIIMYNNFDVLKIKWEDVLPYMFSMRLIPSNWMRFD